MRNAKKTLSLVMIAIFTTFIVLSGIPTSAVTKKTTKVTAAQKAAAAKAAAAKAAKAKADAAKKLADAKAKAEAAKKAVATAAQKAVDKAETLTNTDNYDLEGNDTDLANAQAAVTTALEAIVKLDKDSADYKGLMARVDAANAKIVSAMDTRDANAQAEADKKDQAAKETAADTAVKAVEAAKLATADDITAANALVKTATDAIAAVKDTTKAADFASRVKKVTDNVAALQAKLDKAAADAAAAAAEAKKPATVVSVSAVDGTITVTFNKKPIDGQSVSASDFVITKSVNGAAAVAVTNGTFKVTSDTAVTFSVPAVAAIATADQSVVYSVAYSTGAAINTSAYTIAKLPALTATATALNLKQVLVTFNQAVDATTSVAPANYTYTGGTTIATYALQSDNKSVLLTLTGNEAQQAAATLAIANVTSANGLTIAATTLNLSFLDTTLPTVVSATLVAPTKVDVKFSEPVTATALSNAAFALDNNTYSLSGVPTKVAADTIELTLGSVIPSGNHTIAINSTGVAAANLIKDYAGFAMSTASVSFNYVADTTAAVASIYSINQTQAVIKFSKPMTLLGALNTDLTVYHTFNNQASYKGTAVWTDNQTLTVTFTAPIPAGNATIYINNSTDVTKQLQDGWANKFATTTLTGAVTADTTAPTVLNAVKYDANHIDVTFSEAVNGVSTSTFAVKNSAGATVAVNAVAVTTGNTYRLTLGSNMNGDTYTVAIPATTVYDNALVANYLAAYTTSLVVADTSAPTVSATALTDAAGANGTKIQINFSKVMATSGTGSILDLNNYIWSSGSFPTGTSIAAANGNKSVIITFPAANTLAATTVQVGRVYDTLGNPTAGFSTTATVSTDNVLVGDFANGKTINTNTVTVEIDRPLTAIDATKFTVNGSPAASATYVNQLVSNGTVNGALVTLTVDPSNKWATSATPNIAITASGAVTTSFGTKNSAAIAAITTVDATVPVLNTVVVASPTTIKLTYSENINAATVSIYTYTVAGNTVTNASVNNNVVTLTLGTALVGTNATASVTQALEIQDLAGNKIAASATPIVVTDGQGPAILSATIVDGTHIKVVFSENVVASTLNKAGFAVADTTPTAYAVSSIAAGVNASEAILTVADTSAKVGALSLSYTTQAGKNQDAAGNDAATLGAPVTVQ